MRYFLIAVFLTAGMSCCSAFSQDVDHELYKMKPEGLIQQLSGASAQQRVQFTRFNKVDDEKKKTIREDATILNHMISKALPLKNSRTALGVDFVQYFGKNELVYNDHGLTLSYHVSIPLVATEKVASGSESEPKSPWDKAKEELDSVTVISTSRDGTRAALGGLRNLATNMKYDQEYVDRISGQINLALNSAGNFRDLSENDTITVFVYGLADKPGMQSVLAWRVKLKDLAGNRGSDSVESTAYIEDASNGSVTYLPGISGFGR